TELGWTVSDLGATTFEAQHGDVYLFVEQSPALSTGTHDRLAPGVNHLAFHAGTRAHVDAMVAAAPEHGWTLLFPDRHPYPGEPPDPGRPAAAFHAGREPQVELHAAAPGDDLAAQEEHAQRAQHDEDDDADGFDDPHRGAATGTVRWVARFRPVPSRRPRRP